VQTTLDSHLQTAAELAVSTGLAELEARTLSAEQRTAPGQDRPQAALFAMDVRDGSVRAMVGGRSFEDSQFNRATQAHRQVGSAIKPIIYLTAMEAGLSPATLTTDAPVSYWDPWTRQRWSPRNYTRKFAGRITLMQGMEESINITAVKLVDQLGIEKVLETARRLGITNDLPPYLSIALGTAEVSLQEMVTAYATIAGYGLRPIPRLITSVVNPTGDELWSSRSETIEVLDQGDAYLVIQLLEGVIQRGTGQSARALGRDLDLDLAGKTGTTDEYTDAWFIGFSPELAAGVWVGYDVTHPLGPRETGGRAALPLWKMFMATALQHRLVTRFLVPPSFRPVAICRQSGSIANARCPDTFTVNLPPDRFPGQTCRQH
ncbi:penicillin-binding protein 1A, partial [bacterium]|nr:penicillin-binding protein 1A [candidate division CSSED10-310 bacterium]